MLIATSLSSLLSLSSLSSLKVSFIPFVILNYIRERFICTRDGAGDAQEFVDYYLGDITRSSMPAKSLVVNDATERAVETHAEKMPVARHTNILFERK